MRERLIIPLVCAALAAHTVAGCGRKVALVPRSDLAPVAVQDLHVSGRDNAALLRWTVPSADIRGVPVRDINRFTILREARPAADPECGSCPGHFEVMTDITATAGTGYFVPGGAYEFVDAPLTYGVRYRYRVTAATAAGRVAGKSNTAELYWDPPPAPPSALKGLAGDRHVLLSWADADLNVDGTPLSGATGYTVYRKSDGDPLSFLPVNTSPVTETTYTDGGLENHRQYTYTVRTLKKVRDSVIEGPPSNEILLVPYRSDLPPRPEGVMAACAGGAVELTWKPAGSSEVVGYHVYRKTRGDVRAVRITDTPVTQCRLRDGGIRGAREYRYAVRAVEGPPLARESIPSAEAVITCR